MNKIEKIEVQEKINELKIIVTTISKIRGFTSKSDLSME
jgi:hypothetical protein